MTSSKLDEDHEEILWTMEKVAKQLSVSTKTVSRLVQKGKLPSIRFGRNVRIEKQAVYHFIEREREYNVECVESVLSHTGESLCDSISETVSTKLPTNQQVENKLDALLKPLKRE